MLIPLKQYAEKWQLSPVSIRRRCIRGTIRSAVKIGRDWWIDEDDELIDYRTYPYCLDRRYGTDPKEKKVNSVNEYSIKPE